MSRLAAVMVHPLVRLAASRPQMLAEHVAAYVSLMTEEVAIAATQVRRRLSLQLIGIGCVGIGVVLAGVAVMLWASLPVANAPWALVLTPLIPALCGAAALRIAASEETRDPFAPLQRQLAADAAMLRRAVES
jgi:hypothetical protein